MLKMTVTPQSAVRWAQEGQGQRTEVRMRIAQSIGWSYDDLYASWGDVVVVRKGLFNVRKDGGGLEPKYSMDVASWKRAIKEYCAWHDVAGLGDMVSFWCDLVSAFIESDFDNKASAEFRAYIYGCAAKFMLLQRQEKSRRAQDLAYSPGHPSV